MSQSLYSLAAVLAERSRQIAKGYDERSDDREGSAALALAAAAYLAHDSGGPSVALRIWPWPRDLFHPCDERDNLLRGAALALAALEAYDRERPFKERKADKYAGTDQRIARLRIEYTPGQMDEEPR